MNKLGNYITGHWITGDGEGQLLYNAVTGDAMGAATTKGLDFGSIADYARMVGNPAELGSRYLISTAQQVPVLKSQVFIFHIGSATTITFGLCRGPKRCRT